MARWRAAEQQLAEQQAALSASEADRQALGTQVRVVAAVRCGCCCSPERGTVVMTVPKALVVFRDHAIPSPGEPLTNDWVCVLEYLIWTRNCLGDFETQTVLNLRPNHD